MPDGVGWEWGGQGMTAAHTDPDPPLFGGGTDLGPLFRGGGAESSNSDLSSSARLADSGSGLCLHVLGAAGYLPMEPSADRPVEFELQAFRGRCAFLHRPGWSYDNQDAGDYPYKEHFHGRRRLWEWRCQGQFKRMPSLPPFIGIELERYVPVSWGTKMLMRGILPVLRKVIKCSDVNHEMGRAGDDDLRPSVVGPIWAVDNTIISYDASEVPDLCQTSLPQGLDRKAAREFWDDFQNGKRPAEWEAAGELGPTFTFALWGPSQICDLRSWVFRRLPFMPHKVLEMDPFCGMQAVHAVVYELDNGATASEHRQRSKVYFSDLRIAADSNRHGLPPLAPGFRETVQAPEFGATMMEMGRAHSADSPSQSSAAPSLRRSPSDDSFCSAISWEELPDDDGRGTATEVDRCLRESRNPVHSRLLHALSSEHPLATETLAEALGQLNQLIKDVSELEPLRQSEAADALAGEEGSLLGAQPLTEWSELQALESRLQTIAGSSENSGGVAVVDNGAAADFARALARLSNTHYALLARLAREAPRGYSVPACCHATGLSCGALGGGAGAAATALRLRGVGRALSSLWGRPGGGSGADAGEGPRQRGSSPAAPRAARTSPASQLTRCLSGDGRQSLSGRAERRARGSAQASLELLARLRDPSDSPRGALGGCMQQ